MSAVGVDACKGGWVAVARRDTGCSVHFLRNIHALVDAVPDASAIAIDIPIGLLERGQREADVAVRAMLGARRNSLFMTPIRAVLEAPTHAEASALSVRSCGFGITRQAYGLRGHILQVEAWLTSAPCRVVEVHPELCFAELRGGSPASASKKTWHGMLERRAALRSAGIALDDVDPRVGGVVPVDDLLDAAAAAWTAGRVLAGTARSVPDPPQLASDGRQIAIWV